MVADRVQLTDRRIDAVGEVGVAVAELLGEVERQALGERTRAHGCRTVEPGEALDHLGRGAEHRLAVPAPLPLASVERGAAADRDERVLEQRPPRGMGMDVPRRDRVDAEVLGEVVEGRMASRVAPLEGTLQLDEEPLPPECGGEPRSTGRIVERKPFARAAGEADEPLAQLRDGLERDGGRQEARGPPCPPARSGMGRGQDAAEVRVALAALAEQRDVRSSIPRSGAGQAGTSAPGRLRRAYAAERHLGAGDRPDAANFAACANSSEP